MLPSKTYQYQLDKSSKKFHCPECNKKRFVRYIDTETGNYLHKQYGRCDREANCGYFLNPYKNGYAKINRSDTLSPKRNVNITPQKQVYYPETLLYKMLDNYDQNSFLQNLLFNVPYPVESYDIEKIIELYYLGTISKGYMKGAITLPFIDINYNIHAIQVKQFDKKNHTIGKANFIHKLIEIHFNEQKKALPEWLNRYLQNERKISCLFGEHLLKKYPDNPIALVEAPKTALYGTLYFGFPDDPDNFLWLAVYNLSSLKYYKCKVLTGRHVVLFPDLSENSTSFKLWNDKAKEFESKLPCATFKISDLLEKYATHEEKLNGLDLADFLIRYDWKEFRYNQDNNFINLKSTDESNTQTKPNIHIPENIAVAFPQEEISNKHSKSNPKVNDPQFHLNDTFTKEQNTKRNNLVQPVFLKHIKPEHPKDHKNFVVYLEPNTERIYMLNHKLRYYLMYLNKNDFYNRTGKILAIKPFDVSKDKYNLRPLKM